MLRSPKEFLLALKSSYVHLRLSVVNARETLEMA